MEPIAAKTNDELMKLAYRLAHKISPLDSNLEREVINIYDCLTEAYYIGYFIGFRDGETVGWIDGREYEAK